MRAGSDDPVLAGEDIRLLAEIGYLACGAGRLKSAREIFEGLHVLRPDRAFPFIGLAMASMAAGAPQDAVSVLRDRGLVASPDDNEIKVFLGLALTLASRNHESRRILSEVAAAPGDAGPEQRLAEKLLEHAGTSHASGPAADTALAPASRPTRIEPI